MKLINKFTLWYLCITLSCTLVGSFITYYNIKSRIDKAATERLTNINDKIAGQIRQGIARDSIFEGKAITVKTLATPLPKKKNEVAGISFFNPDTKQHECRLKVNSFYTINNQHYSISSYDTVTKSEQILSGIEYSIFWKWLWILTVIAISARLVSKAILSPFNKTLKIIEGFSIRQKQKIELPETRTKEFKELNNFLQKMTDKAVEDYASLKEFSENASHELQTPVAVMRGKLDLLAESGLRDEQALLIADIQNSLEKLSRINKSLILLTKLENHEYEATENICISNLLTDSVSSYKELMDMKSITFTAHIQDGIYTNLHPQLADLLLNNLFSNAIRHNIPNGHIELSLCDKYFQIKNTGRQPEVPVEELFKRFKKSNQCNNSIGIGLSIVKQICEVNGFDIQYSYEDGWHTLQVIFAVNMNNIETATYTPTEEPIATHLQTA